MKGYEGRRKGINERGYDIVEEEGAGNGSAQCEMRLGDFGSLPTM